MTLSITENILNLQQTLICKRFLQVGKDNEIICNASLVSAGVAKALEYEKYHTARLESEASQPDVNFDKVVKKLIAGDQKGVE